MCVRERGRKRDYLVGLLCGACSNSLHYVYLPHYKSENIYGVGKFFAGRKSHFPPNFEFFCGEKYHNNDAYVNVEKTFIFSHTENK